MVKLKLIVADDDRDYVQSLERYILVNYPHCFELHSFTRPEILSEYLVTSDLRADMMLLGKEYFIDLVQLHKPVIKVLLSEDAGKPENKDHKYIYKYQHAEKLITELTAIYSGNCDNEFLPHGQKTSHVAAVFSGAGGSGKTSVAVCSSKLCAARGNKVLYLNLEAVCSTPVFFNGNSSQTFSNVIYYLKENNSNLASKIEGARCIDPDSGVYFFKPANNLQDIEELLFDEAELLINTLKGAAFYDVIFVDLSCGLTTRNLAVLKACDCVLNVAADRPDAIVKENLLKAEYEYINERYGFDLSGKSICVSNMNRGVQADDTVNVIGFYPEMEQKSSSAYTDCIEFADDIGRLLNSIMKEERKSVFYSDDCQDIATNA